ncbi:hypothetical protein ACFSQJ_19740 [Croceitalea marina]|uniref:DUF306 domain-containing protein n=1 Tax=Croceitalea marina TaxID=1775166 RepID=A0ABW5N228_9FLAO
MKRKFALAIVVLLVLSCSNDNGDSNNCEFQTVINDELYRNSPSALLTINDLEISGNCLRIDFSSSGCSGNTWELNLIDSGAILESFPPQRMLRLTLKNEELCEALFTKQLTFDISNLKVDGNTVLLNVEGYEDKILYKY